MQELVAGMESLRFALEADAEQQRGAQPLPFPGVPKLGAAVCRLCARAECWDGLATGPVPLCKFGDTRGDGVQCPFRQAGVERAVVCKHWLRGLCKKGDGCGFLHAYDVSKVPECYFHSKLGECSNKDCPFLHIDATADNGACPWYDRGFCRHGPLCKYKHTRRVLCANYLVGFCPEGPKCKFMHLKAGLMTRSADPAKGAESPQELAWLAPAAGGESSPEAVPPAEPPPLAAGAAQHGAAQPRDTSSVPPSLQRLLEPGTCFKCGQKGHYAGKCKKNQLEILLGK